MPEDYKRSGLGLVMFNKEVNPGYSAFSLTTKSSGGSTTTLVFDVLSTTANLYPPGS